MEVALIPPISLLKHTEKTQMQLMLPLAETLDRRDYMASYKWHLRSPSQYVIMDNGAAEAQKIDDKYLVYLAEFYEPNELAIPDHLGDMANTVKHAEDFIDRFGVRLVLDRQIKLGYVAQGCDAEEAFYGVQKIIARYGWMVDTIYLPRLLVKPKEGRNERIKLAYFINNTWGNTYDIHLFGASKYWPGEVCIASQLPYIRSIDTSLPYQLSFAMRTMKRVPGPGRLVDRPEKYFSQPDKLFPNIDTYVERYLMWARANTHTPSVKNVL